MFSPRPALASPPRAALACLAAAALAACGPSGAGGRSERIVLITVDTLRYDRFEGERASMPHTARAARSGLVFDRFYSSTSSTQPTHASLFTGLHPWQTGVPRNGAVLREGAETLAELLQRAGYFTAAAVASFPLHRTFGWDQGFDVFDDRFARHNTLHEWNGVELEGGFYDLADTLVETALEQIDAAPDRHQFFWFHFYDPHAPYGDTTAQSLLLSKLHGAAKRRQGELPALLERARALYDADVAALDAAIGRLLERLERDRDRFETHVVITADHGESFGEGGSFGHGKRVIRSQVHVPTVVLSPRAAAERRGEPAGSVDVFATILSLAGVAAPAGTYGRDLTAPAPEGATAFGMRRTFAEPFEEIRADGSRVTVFEPRFFCARGAELFIGDKGEVFADDERDAANGRDGAAPSDDLAALFATFEAELLGQPVDERLDPETQRALEALGYAR